MDWKRILNTTIHAAIGGFAAAIPVGGPITATTTLLPGLLSAATSAASALSDNTKSNPLIHAAVGAGVVAAGAALSGNLDFAHALLPQLFPILMSGMTSFYSAQVPPNAAIASQTQNKLQQ